MLLGVAAKDLLFGRGPSLRPGKSFEESGETLGQLRVMARRVQLRECRVADDFHSALAREFFEPSGEIAEAPRL